MKKNLTLFVFIVIGIFSVTAAAPNWGVADTLEHYEIGPRYRVHQNQIRIGSPHTVGDHYRHDQSLQCN